MIELCRRGDFTAALAFSRKFIKWDKFVSMLFVGGQTFKKECRQTLLLMLYGDDAESPVAYLLHPMRKSFIERYVVDKIIEYDGRQTGSNNISFFFRIKCWTFKVIKMSMFYILPF